MNDRRAQPATIELPSGDQLRVVFGWTNDRYSHRILCGETTVASSVEGNPDQDFPPSPPLQQLSLENLDGRDVVLGVGAAGRGHWSVSVEPVTLDDGSAALKFDWACRTSETDAELGTTYDSVDTSLRSGLQKSTMMKHDGDSLAFAPPAVAPSTTHQWTYTISLGSN